jgi:hypothetical protein
MMQAHIDEFMALRRLALEIEGRGDVPADLRYRVARILKSAPVELPPVERVSAFMADTAEERE